MRCPFCGATESKVIDSRLTSDSSQVRRRRQCLECAERMTTYEIAELNLPRIIKSRGNREPFSVDKLYAGFQRALEKRPASVESIDAAISRIKHRCVRTGKREIKSRLLGEWVMDELRALDQVAYIRFASVYRSFEDANAFRDVLDKLEKELTPEQTKMQLPLLDENG